MNPSKISRYISKFVLFDKVYLICWFETRVGDFCNSQLFMIGFLCRNDGSVSGQREVDAGVRHKVSLELSQVDV